MKIVRKLLVASCLVASALVATPASAAYYIVYWIDYPGGSWAGYELYCDGGNLIEDVGTDAGTPTYHYVGPYPC